MNTCSILNSKCNFSLRLKNINILLGNRFPSCFPNFVLAIIMVYLGFSPGPEYIPIFFIKPNILGIFNNTRTLYILRVILCYDVIYKYIHVTCCNNMLTNAYIFCIVRHDTDLRLNTAYCINNVLLFILVKTMHISHMIRMVVIGCCWD